MPTTEREIDGFAAFAKQWLAAGDGKLSLDEIYDEWRTRNPPREDALAIAAAIRDMEQGEEGQPFAEFADEFRTRNSISGE